MYGTLYWFILGLWAAIWHNVTLLKRFVRSPVLDTQNFLLELVGPCVNSISTAFWIVNDYDADLAFTGLVLICLFLIWCLWLILQVLVRRIILCVF